jgi:SSS family transporter
MNNTFSTPDYVVLIAYLVITLGIGIWFSKKESTSEEYLLGGRRMPWWAVGISIMVSLLSAISMVAAPGEAYNNGLTLGVFTLVLGWCFAIPAFFVFTRFYFRVKTFTPFGYLEHRFDHRVRLAASGIYCFIRIIYLGIVLYASAKIFQSVAGWPPWVTIILIGTIGTVYTTLGGMKAVIWTDVLQFVVLAGGLIVILGACVFMVEGNLSGIFSYSFSHGRGFEAVNQPGFFTLSPFVRLTFVGLILVMLSDSLFTYSADQLAIQRLLSTSSYAMAKRSFFAFLFLSAILVAMLYILGLGMFAFYGQRSMTSDVDGDTALFKFVVTYLPTPIPGLFIAAALAAVMSTLDSGMNALAAVSTKDLYLRHLHPMATESSQVSFSRGVTVAVGVIATAMSLLISSVSERMGGTFLEVASVWGSFGAVLAPSFLLGVTTTRAQARHVLWSMGIGLIVTLGAVTAYFITKNTDHPVSFYTSSILGSVVMTVVGYVPSILRWERAPEVKTNGLTLWTLRRGEAGRRLGD